MPVTLLNKKLLEMVKDLYVKPEKGAIMGSYDLMTLSWEMSQGLVNRGSRSQKSRKKNTRKKMHRVT